VPRRAHLRLHELTDASLEQSPAAVDPMTPRHKPRLLVPAGVVAGFGVLVVLLTIESVHAFAPDSDGATVVLQGQVMKAGHLMLHGWSLSLDSFWTVDAAIYSVVELVTGMRSILLYLVPAIIAALVTLVGAWLARDNRPGAGGVVAAATVVVLLGLPVRLFASVFVSGPLHVGTALWCLIAFAGLRSGRFDRGWVVAVVFLVAGALGDFQMAVLGIASSFGAGIVAMLRTRDWRSGLPQVSAAGCALLLAGVVRELSDAVGTFTINTSHPTASSSQMLENVQHIATWGAHMLGIGRGYIGNGGVPPVLQAVHAVGLVVVVVGVVVALGALVRGVIRGGSSAADVTGTWRLDDLLVCGLLCDLALFMVLTSSNNQAFMRYLTAAVIFGSILGGRWMGRRATAIASAPRPPVGTTRFKRGAAALALVVVAAYGAAFGLSLTAPIPPRPYQALGQFLESHQLFHGIGDYWSASITTVATDGVVTVRPVITNPKGIVVRYQRQSTISWYAGKSFEFLVYNTALPWGGVKSATAAATFGRIDRTYAVGTYRVLVWSHPVSVPADGFAPVPLPSPQRANS
jgi:hypothetical protein